MPRSAPSTRVRSESSCRARRLRRRRCAVGAQRLRQRAFRSSSSGRSCERTSPPGPSPRARSSRRPRSSSWNAHARAMPSVRARGCTGLGSPARARELTLRSAQAARDRGVALLETERGRARLASLRRPARGPRPRSSARHRARQILLELDCDETERPSRSTDAASRRTHPHGTSVPSASRSGGLSMPWHRRAAPRTSTISRGCRPCGRGGFRERRTGHKRADPRHRRYALP